jgi:hypothetical protein
MKEKHCVFCERATDFLKIVTLHSVYVQEGNDSMEISLICYFVSEMYVSMQEDIVKHCLDRAQHLPRCKYY